VPLDTAMRESGDAGEPVVWAEPDSDSARAIRDLAAAVVDTRRERGVGIVKSLPLVS
jgi:MinD-like ATPase involved in chromosome partitioning or flagellar assembly